MTEQEFTEWFCKNYPKDTEIHDPAWHAPRIYRAVQPAASTPSKPVLYQVRTRPNWDARHPWSEWKDCSADAYRDYIKTPVLHDWQYEARKLYTESAPSDAEISRLTECLAKANAQAEEFERKFYLKSDECEKLQAQLAAPAPSEPKGWAGYVTVAEGQILKPSRHLPDGTYALINRDAWEKAAPAQSDLTDKLIDAAEHYAAVYDGDDRECVKADVMNGFYQGAHWAMKNAAPAPSDGNLDGAIDFIRAAVGGQPIWPNAWGQDVAFVAFTLHKLRDRIAELEAAFHQNMMRAYPERTHAEISAEIERIKNSA